MKHLATLLLVAITSALISWYITQKYYLDAIGNLVVTSQVSSLKHDLWILGVPSPEIKCKIANMFMFTIYTLEGGTKKRMVLIEREKWTKQTLDYASEILKEHESQKISEFAASCKSPLQPSS